MFARENESFPPLTSASPRLLFDFLPALMSPRLEKPKRNDADPNLIFPCVTAMAIKRFVDGEEQDHLLAENSPADVAEEEP